MTDILTEISVYFMRLAIPVIIVASLIGNILNVAVLGRRKIRKHSCSLYFIALSINNLLYTVTILIVNLLANGYQINLTAQSLIICKLVNYFGSLFSALALSFMVMASIDRWSSSSLILYRRNIHNTRTTKQRIFKVIITFALLFISSLIMTSSDVNDTIVCRIRGDGFFVTAYNTLIFLLFSCLAPALMLVFGCLTVINIHKRCRIPTRLLSIYRRTENQLIRMLLVQVGVQLLLILPICIVSLMLSFPNFYKPTPRFYAVLFISRVLFHVSFATPFFLYTLSSHTYRTEFVQLIVERFTCCRYRPNHALYRILYRGTAGEIEYGHTIRA